MILFFCYRKTKGTANSSFYSGRKGCDRMGHKDDAHMDEDPDGKGENNDQKFMKGRGKERWKKSDISEET